MPKLICSRWKTQKGEEKFRLVRVTGRCSFEGVALEAIYGVKYGYKEIWDDWISRLDHECVRQNNKDWICEYLCSERYDKLECGYRDPSSNLLWEFESMTQLIGGESSSRRQSFEFSSKAPAKAVEESSNGGEEELEEDESFDVIGS